MIARLSTYCFNGAELMEFLRKAMQDAEFVILQKNIQLGRLQCDSLAWREALCATHKGALAVKDKEIELLREALGKAISENSASK